VGELINIRSQARPFVVGVRNISGFVFRKGRPSKVRLDRHESVQFGEFVEVLAVLGLVKVAHLGGGINLPLAIRVLYNARIGPDKVGAAIILAAHGHVPNLAVITHVVVCGLPRIGHLIFMNIFLPYDVVFEDWCVILVALYPDSAVQTQVFGSLLSVFKGREAPDENVSAFVAEREEMVHYSFSLSATLTKKYPTPMKCHIEFRLN
jgi:hypothetical protein